MKIGYAWNESFPKTDQNKLLSVSTYFQFSLRVEHSKKILYSPFFEQIFPLACSILFLQLFCFLAVDVDVTPTVAPRVCDVVEDDHDHVFDQPDSPHLTDRLLNKIPAEKEQEKTNYDVQIGDGMDIVIVGENGQFIHYQG